MLMRERCVWVLRTGGESPAAQRSGQGPAPVEWSGPCHVQGKCPSVETRTGWCPVPDKDGKVSGQNGQSCFWVRPGSVQTCVPTPGPWPLAPVQISHSLIFLYAVFERLCRGMRHL